MGMPSGYGTSSGGFGTSGGSSGAGGGGYSGGQTSGGYGSLPSSTWNERNNLSIGGTDPQANMRLAGENLPGAPFWLQRQMAGLYGAPMISSGGVQDYGRWNWQNQQLPGGPRPAPGSAQPQAPAGTATQQPGQGGLTAPRMPILTAPGQADPWLSTPQPYTGPASYAPVPQPGSQARSPSSGSVGDDSWWAAVRNAQQPGTNIPPWLQGR